MAAADPDPGGAAPVCATLAGCRRHEGRRVAAVGIYTAVDPYPRRKADAELPRLARLAMDDTPDGPFLEPFWDAAAARSEAEIARLAGRRVRVTGRFHAAQPPRPGAHPAEPAFGGPCIHPVESVEDAEDGG